MENEELRRIDLSKERGGEVYAPVPLEGVLRQLEIKLTARYSKTINVDIVNIIRMAAKREKAD